MLTLRTGGSHEACSASTGTGLEVACRTILTIASLTALRAVHTSWACCANIEAHKHMNAQTHQTVLHVFIHSKIRAQRLTCWQEMNRNIVYLKHPFTTLGYISTNTNGCGNVNLPTDQYSYTHGGLDCVSCSIHVTCIKPVNLAILNGKHNIQRLFPSGAVHMTLWATLDSPVSHVNPV